MKARFYVIHLNLKNNDLLFLEKNSKNVQPIQIFDCELAFF